LSTVTDLVFEAGGRCKTVGTVIGRGKKKGVQLGAVLSCRGPEKGKRALRAGIPLNGKG